MGDATWLLLAGLLIGKQVGILLFGWIATKPLWLGIPREMRVVDLDVTGCVVAIGFTVSVFVASVALDPNATQDLEKTAALFRFAVAILSITFGKIRRVPKMPA